MNLAFEKFNQFQEDKNKESISSAVQYLRKALERQHSQAQDDPSHITLLSVFLAHQHHITGNDNDLDQAIKASCEAVKAPTDQDLPKRATVFHNLRVVLLRRHQRTGDAEALKRAAATMEQLRAEYAAGLDHAGPVAKIDNTPWILDILFDIHVQTWDTLREPSHLDQAIETGHAIEALDSGLAREQMNAVNTLSDLHSSHYDAQHARHDIDLAIAACEKAIRLARATHDDAAVRAAAHHNLAVALRKRFQASPATNLADLHAAIDAACRAAAAAAAA
jgi:hypothetical protein